MQILSATEAISPALSRTKQFLYSPFQLGRTWKLSATAYLSFAGTIFLPFTLFYTLAGFAMPHIPAMLRSIMIAGGIGLTAVYIVVFWLCGHLKFAFFEMVLQDEKFVAPAWRRCGEQARKWTLVKMLVGTVFTLIAALPAVAYAKPLFRAMAAVKTQGTSAGVQPMSPEMVHFMVAFYGTYFLAAVVFGIYFLVMSTISSFVVPAMALENATVRAAFQRFTNFVAREPKQFMAFVGLRLGMAIAGYMAFLFAYEIVLLLLGAILALICLCIGLLLHLIGVPTSVLFVLGVVVFVLFITVVNIYLCFLALGPFFTFFEAHTLYFLGGRYAMLGDLLDRSTPPPAQFMPPPYDPAYYMPPQV